jgi:uncharacterized protein with NRDE domain
MCTFTMLYKQLLDYPVVALHNRYLGLDTVEEPPRKMNKDIFAPYDVASKGTWIGMNKDGLFMAITNQETQTIDNPKRSRGLLVLDVLRDCVSSNEARDYLNDKSIRHKYRTSNFIVADAEKAYHVIWDVSTFTREIKPGPYAVGVVTKYPELEITERAKEMWHSSEIRRLRAYRLLSEFNPASVDDAISKMMEVSRDHEYGKTVRSICWHSDKYKQTSSTIMAVGDTPKVLFCLGNHCENEFVAQNVSF